MLDDDLIKKIKEEAQGILCTLGVEIHNKTAIDLFASHGVSSDKDTARIVYTEALIEKSLQSVPSSFSLFDINGEEKTHFSGFNIHFTPGSTALKLYDCQAEKIRTPSIKDYIAYVKVVDQLPHMASQSTAFIPSDIDNKIADSFRLFLSLLYGTKPVVTGVFSADAFEVMHDFQRIIRGSDVELRAKPLTVFSCCPTSPLTWGPDSCQNLIDCARANIPVEIIPMPLSGFLSPVTLTGTLIQHCAEVLSGIVIHQLANPGAPLLYGGSITIFDMRHETTPMGAIESMMMSSAANEIGKSLGLPTQAYISLSDAKYLDVQAGLETGMGAIMAALSGINNISGPGMMEFENCFSLEKLVVDNEIAGMALHLTKGINPKDDLPALPLFKELLTEKQLIIADHTLRHLSNEHYFPGPVINRQNTSRWEASGSPSVNLIAAKEVEKLITTYKPSPLSAEKKWELLARMQHYAEKFGIKLPEIDMPA
jgi:trimethylamine--corrinoid protein Co-methyltransferase